MAYRTAAAAVRLRPIRCRRRAIRLLAAQTAPRAASIATAAAMSAPGGGTLSCSGLEALWESAGGSPGAAFTAAEIAKAESSGRQYATDTNGGASTDRGYWQINSVHGALSTYDAAGNARAAVQLSGNGTDWTPWVTYQPAPTRASARTGTPS